MQGAFLVVIFNCDFIVEAIRWGAAEYDSPQPNGTVGLDGIRPLTTVEGELPAHSSAITVNVRPSLQRRAESFG
jgi:hypothetical protein